MITIIIACIVVLLLIIAATYYFYYRKSPIQKMSVKSTKNIKPVADLEKTLYKNGWRLYTSASCHHCKKQLEMIEYPHKEISTASEKEKKIVIMFPAWVNVISGTIMYGSKTKEQLEEMAQNDFTLTDDDYKAKSD